MLLLSIATAPHAFVSIAWVVGGALLTLGMIFALWRWTLAEGAAAGAHPDDAWFKPPPDAAP